jgi:hypothetical protein
MLGLTVWSLSRAGFSRLFILEPFRVDNCHCAFDDGYPLATDLPEQVAKGTTDGRFCTTSFPASRFVYRATPQLREHGRHDCSFHVNILKKLCRGAKQVGLTECPQVGPGMLAVFGGKIGRASGPHLLVTEFLLTSERPPLFAFGPLKLASSYFDAGHWCIPSRTKKTQETRSPDSLGRLQWNSCTSARITSPGR